MDQKPEIMEAYLSTVNSINDKARVFFSFDKSEE